MPPLDSICDTILQHFPDTSGVYLYGSHATGQAREDSDIDIGILLPHPQYKTIGSLRNSPLRHALENLTNTTVDLVNLRAEASTILQKEVIAAEKLIGCYHPTDCQEFEMYVLSDYQRLNEERAGILAAIQENGIIHAQ